MNKPLYLFVGKSGSGKTTIANALELHGYKQVQSYTTRPPRYDGELGHIFVNQDEFDKLEDLVAYTKYGDYEYCATSNQLDECDIYVIDIPGVRTLLKKYKNESRPIRVIYFNTTVSTRIERMVDRGDSDHHIISRLHIDEKSDWWSDLLDMEEHYYCTKNRNFLCVYIDANNDKSSVLKDVIERFDKEVSYGSSN